MNEYKNNLKLIKVILKLCLVFLVSVNLAFAKAEKSIKKYPPYPEIWGYDILDDLPKKKLASSCSMHITRNNDIVIRFISLLEKNDSVSKFANLEFFNNKITSYLTEEMDFYDKKLGLKYPENILNQYIAYGDDTTIKSRRNDNVNYANRVHNSYLSKATDFNLETEQQRMSVIGIYPIYENGEMVPFKYEVFYLPSQLLKLEDDTFIAFNSHYHLFIRMDRDFNTKFEAQHTVMLDETRELKSNFYILPYSKIEYFYEHIAQGYAGEQTEEINKQLLEYLYQEQQNGNI